MEGLLNLLLGYKAKNSFMYLQVVLTLAYI